MQVSTPFQLKIVNASTAPGEGRQITLIIIRRPYAFLEAEVSRVFQGQEDVEVFVDRRFGERRTSLKGVAVDRRRTDRRTVKEGVLEVILSV